MKLMKGIEESSAKNKHKSLCALLIVVAYVAIQSFGVCGPYFPLDDKQELFHVNSLQNWWQLFGPDAFQLFRPIKNLAFALFSLFPEDMTALCRMMAIAVGCISFFPVTALFRRVFRNERMAIVAVAVWMLAPTLVSSVAWLSCVNIQIMCALAAQMIVLHDKAFDNERVGWLFVAASAALLFLACVSYEMAVVLGPLAVVFDFYLHRARFASRKVIRVYALYVAVTIAYLYLRNMLNATVSIDGNFIAATRLDKMMASAYFTCQHFLVWFWPFGKMTPLGAYSPGCVSTGCLAFCWFVVVVLGVLAFVLRRRNPLAAFGIAFSLVSFIPVSNLLGLGNGPYGDYYMGLPSMGLSVSFVTICASCFSANRRFRMPCFVLGVLLLGSRLLAVVEAAWWAFLWSDGAMAFKSGMEVYPHAFGNYMMYAEVCFDSGRIDEALDTCNKLEELLGPDSEKMYAVYMMRAAEAMYGRKNAEDTLSNLDKAVHVLNVETGYGALRSTHYCRGVCFEDLLNDGESAEIEYRAAIEGQWLSDTPLAADRLARLLAIRGEFDEAEMLWRKVARHLPNDVSVRENLDLLRFKRGRQSESNDDAR